MDSAEQKRLLRRWIDHRDQDAYSTLWSHICSCLTGCLRRELARKGLHTDLEDVIAQTGAEFFRNMQSGKFDINGAASPSTYCMIIARNLLTKQLAGRRYDPLDIDTHAKPDDKETILDLALAIAALPNSSEYPLRDIFLLRQGFRLINGRLVSDFGPLTNTQIAQKYGRERGWVSTRYQMATGILKDKLSR